MRLVRLTKATGAMLVVLMALTLALASSPAQAGTPAPPSARITVTDLAGRRVDVPCPAHRVVAVGPGALRLVCYVQGASRVVGIEDLERRPPLSRPYLLANPGLTKLPVIGPGGPDSVPDAERLVGVGPDVIFAAYLVDRAQADELQAKTGIPVVVLSYGQLATFDAAVYRSLELVGRILGQEGRAREVVAYLQGIEKDLARRAAGLPDKAKPKVYVGALGMKGVHGLESTQAHYPPFAAIGARNVVDETGRTGSVMIDREKLLEWDPEFIFLDLGGYAKVLEDFRRNPQFYRALRAVREGKVYAQIPYNNYTTNLDTALADSYFAGKVLFPERFADVEPTRKADEIYRFLLGKPLYAAVTKAYGGGFGRLELGKP